MTYHINVNKTNIKEFLSIIQQLRNLGVIESVNSTRDLISDGEKIDEETLNNILDNSLKEIKEGKSFTMKDVKNQINNWKKK